MDHDVFFSYHWRDRAAVDTLARALHERGIDVFLDHWYLTPGQPWPRELEQVLSGCRAVAVCVGPGEMGPWQQRETIAALERQGHEDRFPVIPILLPGSVPALGFLGQNTWVDLRLGVDDPLALDVLAAAIRGQPLARKLHQQVPDPRAIVCPYKGLSHFREEDAAFFFGREQSIEALCSAVQRRHFVAVVGASGCGKSSVVRAGLVPRLRQETRRPWEMATVTPGDRPFYNLAAGLMRLLAPSGSETDRLLEVAKQAQDLQAGRVRIRDVVERILDKQPGSERFLLVVDQWEELYTLAAEADAMPFIDGLLEAAATPAMTVVVTLRGDFVGRAFGYRPLADRLQDGLVNLGPMTRDELREAITKPAQQVGAGFEAGLVERIIQDVRDQPGHLPLVEFVLQQLWDDPGRVSGVMRHAAYDAMGGVEQALARYADEVFGRFTDQRGGLRQIFVQLVRPGEGTDDTRQVATRSQIGEANWPLVRPLADSRLIISGRDNTSGEETVEVVHEALIAHWTMLRQWMEEDRAFRRWQNRLRQSMQEWEAAGRDEGALLRGARLNEAEEQLQRAEDIALPEREFIAASRELQSREKRIRQRRSRNTVLGVAAGIVIVAGLGWQVHQRGGDAKKEKEAADEQRVLAAARALAEQSGSVLGNDLIKATLLATESLRRAATVEGYRAWAAAMAVLPRASRQFEHEGDVSRFSLSPDGKRLATAVDLGNHPAAASLAEIWAIDDGRSLARLSHQGAVSDFAFSPDGRMLATASWDHSVSVFDTAEQSELYRFRAEGPVYSVAFDRPQSWLALAGKDRTVRLLEAKTGKEVVRLGHPEPVTDLAFTPDGRFLVTNCTDKNVRVWPAGSEREHARLVHPDVVTSWALTPDGKYLVTAAGSIVRVWEVDGGKLIRQLAHDDKVITVAIDSAGTRIASAGRDRTARIWNLADGRELQRLAHDQRVIRLAFSSDGNILATLPEGTHPAVEPEAVLLWDSRQGKLLHRLQHPDGYVRTFAFHPLTQQLATAGYPDTIRLWDTASGQQVKSIRQQGSLGTIAFSPDGKQLAAASKLNQGGGYSWGYAVVWDTESGKELKRLGGHPRGLKDIRFAERENLLATGSWDGSARVWDAASGQELARLQHAGPPVMSVAFAADDTRLTTGSDSHPERPDRSSYGLYTAHLWDWKAQHSVAVLADPGGVSAFTLSDDRKLAVTSGSDGTIRLWETQRGRAIDRIDCQPVDCSFSFAGKTRLLVVPDAGRNTLEVRDLSNGQVLARLPHTSMVQDYSLSPDGRWLASVVAEGEDRIWLWNVASATLIKRLSHPAANSSDSAAKSSADDKRAGIPAPGFARFSSDSRWLATQQAMVSTSVHLFAAESGLPHGALEHPGAHFVNLLGFSEDGRLAVTATEKLRVWDVAARRELMAVDPGGDLAAARLTPDGRRLVVATRNKVKIWDLKTQSVFGELEPGRERLSGASEIVFSPDRTR